MAGFQLVRQFDVAELGPTDDQLLLLGRQRVPRPQVVDVLLDDHVAAAGERGILVADQDGFTRGGALRILGPVDEAEHVPFIEGAEPVHLVDDDGVPAQPLGQPLGQFEAQVEPVGPDVNEQVTRRRDGSVPRPAQLAERVQASRTRTGAQAIPQVGSDSHHQRQVGLGHPESHRALDPDASARTSPIAASDPGATVSTRKIAASVGMLRIG